MFYLCIREWLPTPISHTGNCVDRGAWLATAHGFTKNRTRIIVLYFNFCGAWRYAVLCLLGQSSPTLCDPMNCSPPCSYALGILQARILEWVAMPSSRGSSQSREQTQVSHTAGGFFTIWATGKPMDTGVSSLSLLQGIFLTSDQIQISWIAGQFFTSLEIYTHL